MDALQALNNRRAVLRFKPDPVEPEKVKLVLQAAANAATAANLQPWAFVVVDQAHLARQVAEYLVKAQAECVFKALLGMPDDVTARQMRAYAEFDKAPCFVLLCIQPKVEFALPEHRAALHEWYLLNAGGALANLMTAATALGLGTRLFSNFTLGDRGQALKGLLGIPEEVDLVTITPLGYHEEGEPEEPPAQTLEGIASFRRGEPATLPNLLRGRLPVQSLVHQNGW
jgi:nitroreductase